MPMPATIPMMHAPADASHHAVMPRTRACVVGEATESEWERLLVEHFPAHTVFHTLPWLRTIETVHGATVRLARADIDGQPVALWPVFVTRKGPLRILGSPLPGWSTPYLGPIFSPACDAQKVLSAFLSHDLFRASYIACKNLCIDLDLAPHGFDEVEKFDTYCIDLTQPRETLWSNLKSECRTRIRKAEKLGLEVRYEQDDSFLDQYWAMSLETFGNCNIKPMFTREFLNQMWRNLHPSGSVCAISAFLEGERIAALMLPYDGHTMYYWSGVSWLRCRGIPAHNLLIWEALAHGQRLGLRRFDFVAINGGGGRFKRTFGPEALHMSTHWERTSSRLVRLLKNGYQQFLLQRRKVSG